MKLPRLLPVLLAMLTPGAAMATDSDLRTVAGMANHNRVLLVFAPTLKDGRLVAQQAEFAKFGVGAAERDLLFVQVAERNVLGARDDAERLRRKFRVGPDDYRALLIGKDGNVALTQAAPLPADRLQATIDAMPMRRAEVARAKAGLGGPSN